MGGPWEKFTPQAEGPWARFAPPVSTDGTTSVVPGQETDEQLAAEAAGIGLGDVRKRAGVNVDARAHNATPERRAELAAESRTRTRQIAKGMTFGFAPRIEAALNAGLGGGDYATELAAIRRGNAQYETDHPWASMALQGAGGVVTGGAVAPAFGGGRAIASNIASRLLPASAADAVGLAGGMTAAGAAAGAVNGVAASDDLTKLPDVAADAWEGAKHGTVGGAAFGAGYLGARAGGAVARQGIDFANNALGRVFGVGGERWAERHIRDQVADLLRRNGVIPAEGVTPATARGVEHAAARFMDDRFLSQAPPGTPTNVGYVLNDALGRTALDAMRTRGADISPLRESAGRMTGVLPDMARAAVDAPGLPAAPSHVTREALRHTANEGMTPHYDAIANTVVDVPNVARYARRDQNVTPILEAAARDAHSEGRLPQQMVQPTIDMGAPVPGMQGVLQPAQTTVGAVENMLRKASRPAASDGDAITSRAISEQLQDAVRADAAAGGQNADLARLMRTRAEHRRHNERLEAYDRGYNALGAEGTPRQEVLAAMERANATPALAHQVEEQGIGARQRLRDAVGGNTEQTMGNIARDVAPESRREVLAAALRSRTQADDIAEAFTDIGRRATYAHSVERGLSADPAPIKDLPEILGRAAVSYQFTPGTGLARLIQYSGGMNRQRANAVLRQMSRDAEGTVGQNGALHAPTRDEFVQMARDIISSQLTSDRTRRVLRNGTTAAAGYMAREGVE